MQTAKILCLPALTRLYQNHLRLTKNNSIPPKSNNNRITKNGEVNPFNLNNKYETASSPSKNPRLAFKIKPNKEKRKRNKRINPGIKIVNCKL
jgi:hypothetical protein